MLPGVPSYAVVLEARRSHPDLFRSPLPPLSELLAGVPDIEIEHETIGVPGTDWHNEPDWLTEDERETYADVEARAARPPGLRHAAAPEPAAALAGS